MTRIVWVTLSALAIAGAQPSAAKETARTAAGGGDTASGVEQQLEPTLKAFEDAWNRHDPKSLAAVFADDAVLINPSGRIARGRGEIEKLFEDEHTRGPLKDTEFSHRLTDVRQVAPGLVFVDEEMTIRGLRDPDGRPIPERRVHGALLLGNRGGTWQVIEGRPYYFAPPAGQRAVAGAAAPGGASQGGTTTGGSSGSGAPDDTNAGARPKESSAAPGATDDSHGKRR